MSGISFNKHCQEHAVALAKGPPYMMLVSQGSLCGVESVQAKNIVVSCYSEYRYSGS